MANKGALCLVAFLLVGVICLTFVLLPSGGGVKKPAVVRPQILPGEGNPLDISVASPGGNKPVREKPKRPGPNDKMVEYVDEDEIYDKNGLAKLVVFKVNNKEKISLLAADPTPVDWTKPYILLLHDAQEQAKIWDQLGTMEALVNAGYRTRALNLPGRGETTTFQSNIGNKGRWMRDVMDDYGLYPFIIVMPSTGSVYGTPFIRSLFEFNNQHALVGVVAVGPTHMPPIAKISPRPTLLLYGEDDPLYLRDSARITEQKLEHVTVKLISDAGHKCWDDNPGEFNTVLLSWLSSIEEY